MRGTRGATRSSGQRLLYPPPGLDLRFAETKSLTDWVSGSNLITFSRASSGTYVGSDGVLKTATTNLLLRSEEIGTSPWGTNIAGAVTYTANAIVAPTGTVTADRVTATADFAGLNQFVSATSGLSYSLSFYVKAVTPGSLDSIRIECFSGRFAMFNMTTRVFSGVNPAITPSSVSLSDGWVRVQCLFAAPTTGSLAVAVYASTSSDFYIWGAQLEQSSTVGEYIPTTSTINSAPRFDHDPLTGESLGLLVEESRTNGIRNSTMVGAVAGTPGTNPNLWLYASTQSNGLTVSIVGTGVENGINYIDYRFNGTTVASPSSCAIGFDNAGATTGQTWTQSLYWKLAAGTATGVNNWQLGIIENTAVGAFVTGAFYTQTAPTANTLIAQRPAATRTLSGGATVGQVSATLNIQVAGNTAIDFTLRIGLPQLEQGAFATSPILTSGAAATRSADVASITGASFSSWYRQDEGTVFADLVTTRRGHSGYPRLVGIFGSDINASNEFAIYTRNIGTADDYKMYGVVTDGSVSGDFDPPASAPVGSGRVALGAKQNNGALTINGLSPVTDNTLNMPATPVQLLLFSNARYQTRTSGTIRRLAYWPQRLPNNTLIALTR